MISFQLTLKGYNGATDKTDHLVKWVNTPTRGALDTFIRDQSLNVVEINELSAPNWWGRVLGFDEGVDVELNENGSVVAGTLGSTEL